MNSKRTILAIFIFVTVGLSVIAYFYLFQSHQSRYSLIRDYIDEGLQLDEKSLKTIKYQNSLELSFITDNNNSTHLLFIDNEKVISYVYFHSTGYQDQEIYWKLNKWDKNYLLAGMIYNNDIKNIVVDGSKVENLKWIEYRNKKIFIVVSDTLDQPIGIRGYSINNKLIYYNKD